MAEAEAETLVLKGLKSFPEEAAREALKDQWEEIETKGLTPSRANDAAYFLKLALRHRGFAASEVRSEILDGDTLQLSVEEGGRQLLGEIRILGAKALDADLLREAMVREMKERQSLLDLGADLPFVKGAIVRGVEAIQGYARHQGHLRARAELATLAHPNGEGRVEVVVRLVEGPAYAIESVTVVGIEGRLYAKLKRLTEPMVGRPLNVANVREIQGSLLRELNDRGYFDAEVAVIRGAPGEDLEETEVEVLIEVETGRMYRVNEVQVTGCQKTPEAFLQKRFEPMLGQPYNPEQVRQLFRELAQTGLFDDIEVTPAPSAEGVMRLDVRVEEAKPRHLGLYGGFGSFDGYIVGTSYTARNLFGTMRSLRSRLEINGRGLVGELNYLDRWFLDSPWQFGAQVFAGTRDLQGYDKWGVDARLTFRRSLTDHTALSLYGSYAHASLTANQFVDVEVGLEDYQTQIFGAALTWDHREDLESRRHGYIWEMSVDYATNFLASDVSFLRAQGRLAHYWKLGWDTELRLGVRAGTLHPLGNSEVIPVDLRFFNGGSQSVRSFPERELGPRDRRHHPTGGEFYTVFNAEYSIPLPDEFSLALFGDAGNLLAEIEDFSLDDMHYAVGLGLRYDLPIGPLRVDYGFNLNRKSGEPKGSFHLGFGFAF